MCCFEQILKVTPHIYLKEGVVPKARHKSIPVPFYFSEPVRLALWENVKRGIITPVPVGMPTDRYCTMVITAKKNGKPWRTIDYQHLNSQCIQSHHSTPPCSQWACRVLFIPTKSTSSHRAQTLVVVCQMLLSVTDITNSWAEPHFKATRRVIGEIIKSQHS